jgi:superfamily II DNA helicase RecQ
MSTALVPVADDDEFGDASFLDNFDVDAAVAAARTPAMEEKPAKRAKLSPDNHNRNNDCLEDSLQKHFGFSHFRPGQKEAIQAILDGQDVAIFWATGAGKSICYQLPALLSNRVTVVISPLISLMQDQVHKLNGLSEHNLATYLGSSQADPMEEMRALQGKYSLIYVTPEKLVSSAGFLDQLANLNLALIAVDESHCIR